VKAIVGLVLGLRFTHSLGLLHRHLTVNNVLFNDDGVVQITHFCLNRLMKPEGNIDGIVDMGGLFGECLMPTSGCPGFCRKSLRDLNRWFKSRRCESSGRSWICYGNT
jgi:serine/threonine protein kinase